MLEVVATGVVTLIVALLECFYGYRLVKFWIALFGFGAGAMLGYAVLSELKVPSFVPWLVALVLGLLLAAIAFRLYRLGVFMLCVLLTYVLSYAFIPSPRWLVLAVGLGGGAIIGALALLYTRPILSVLTALVGGFSIPKAVLSFQAVAALVGGAKTGTANVICIVTGIILAVLGILFQFKFSAKKN
ncbi:MAG: DUF4203 domain-containing protein [Ruthenibacterium sp.]